MEHGVRIKLAERGLHGLFVRDVGLQEVMARRGHDLRESLAPPGIGQFVDGEHVVVLAHGMADGRGANEPGAPRHHQSHTSLQAPALLSIPSLGAGGNRGFKTPPLRNAVATS
jgi:hypothetical protein